MANINVDIDLEEFSTSEIIEEIEDRIERAVRTIKTSGKQYYIKNAGSEIAEIRKAASAFIEKIDHTHGIVIDQKHGIITEEINKLGRGRNLYDQQKIDHFFEVINHYTLEQIESRLPK
jgi:hypothetical protein